MEQRVTTLFQRVTVPEQSVTPQEQNATTLLRKVTTLGQNVTTLEQRANAAEQFVAAMEHCAQGKQRPRWCANHKRTCPTCGTSLPPVRFTSRQGGNPRGWQPLRNALKGTEIHLPHI